MRNILIRSAASLALLATASVAIAQQPAAGPETIPPEQIQKLIETLKQRNDQVRQLSERARELEAKAAQTDTLAARVQAAEKAIAVASAKNQALVAIGEEVIASYETMSLGKKIGGREPLTQLYRVRMQNELQAYQDKIAELGFYPEKELQQAKPTPAAN